MSDNGNYDSALRQYMKERVSRAQALKAAGIGLAAAAVPGIAGAAAAPSGGTSAEPGLSLPFYPQVSGTYTPENILDILNVADTAEHLAITFLSAGVNNAATIGLSGLVLEVVQAALAEEIYHAQFLEAAGAHTLTDSFSVPDPKMLGDVNAFLGTIVVAEALFVAAYMAATREFAELGQPTLAKYAYQIGAVEAEHRTLARAALALSGQSAYAPPNNKAYETDLFLYVRDAAKVLSDLGFLGTGPVKASFPGYSAAIAATGALYSGVIQKTPNNASSSVTASGDLTGERT